MGASESTTRTEREEEEQQQQQQQEGNLAATIAAAVVGGVAVVGAAVSIARMLSKEKDDDDDVAIKVPNPTIRERDQYSKGYNYGYNYDNGREICAADRLKIKLVTHEAIAESSTTEYRGMIGRIWCPPSLGRFKMNTDGSCTPNPGPSGGYGGILRDHRGEFVRGFYGFINHSTDGLTAEIHGILRGLKLLSRLGYTGSILETDCKAAYEWVDSEKKRPPGKGKIIPACWDMIMECRSLKNDNNIQILKIGEDANKCADKLAAKALKEKKEYVESKAPPPEIKYFVDQDKRLMDC